VSLPSSGSTVSGSVPIVIAIGTAVSSVNIYTDGIYLASEPHLIIDWNSNNVTNGNHEISVTAAAKIRQFVGASSVIVNVNSNRAEPAEKALPTRR
jgi:hypothetical protein